MSQGDEVAQRPGFKLKGPRTRVKIRVQAVQSRRDVGNLQINCKWF